MKSTKQKNFIGKKTEIIKSKNKTLEGKKGTIIDETKNMIIIIDEKKQKKSIIKKQVVIKINDEEIKGEEINKTPIERIKVHHK